MANLQDDPLRLLRAYRQAAQLDFTIHPATQAAIRQLAPQLSAVAAERVRVELTYLLANAKGTPWLAAAWHDGLLRTCFNATLEQIKQVAAVDKAAVLLSQDWPTLGMMLSQSVRHPLKTTWLGIAKLTCLVNREPERAEVELTQLTYSRSEIKAVTTAIRLLPQLQLKKVASSQMTLTEQYFFFKSAGTVFPTIAVLAMALGIPGETIAPLIKRYLNPDDLVAHPTPLVTGQDLMQALHLPSSPIIGQLLNAIALSQIEGQISTPAEALQLAAQLVKAF